MRGRLIVALAVTGLWMSALIGISAQPGRSPLEGVWELRDLTFAKPPADPVTKPTGLVIFSGNHYSVIYLSNSARTAMSQPEFAKATADQVRAIWGPLTANSGTFTISGNMLTTRAKVAKNPAFMSPTAFVEQTFTLKGDTLTLTATKHDQGPFANPSTQHWVRAK